MHKCYLEIVWKIIHYPFVSLTLGLQQTGDVELPLSEVKRLFQVLLVASQLDQWEIGQLWSEGTQDGQEGLPTSPARLKVLHTDGATNPRDKKQTQEQKKEEKLEEVMVRISDITLKRDMGLHALMYLKKHNKRHRSSTVALRPAHKMS